MFIGEHKHTIDDKGRLAIPVRFRNKLASGAVVTRGLDNCLFMYPLEEWEEMAKKLAALPLTQANARAFVRLMLAGAMDVEMDKQGRVVMPAYLRKYANLKNSVIVAGLYNRVEIWDEESWSKYQADTEKDSSDIAENLSQLGV